VHVIVVGQPLFEETLGGINDQRPISESSWEGKNPLPSSQIVLQQIPKLNYLNLRSIHVSDCPKSNAGAFCTIRRDVTHVMV
jgi:hypothetical protein